MQSALAEKREIPFSGIGTASESESGSVSQDVAAGESLPETAARESLTVTSGAVFTSAPAATLRLPSAAPLYLPAPAAAAARPEPHAAGSAAAVTQRALVPAIFADLWHHAYVLVLLVTACALCLWRIEQVQQTRDMTSTLNEISLANEQMERQWLVLQARRQELASPSVIRAQAVNRFHMHQPSPESEIVVRLD